MKINDILNLLKRNKVVAILSPDVLENKLLMDRVYLHCKKKIKLVNEWTLEYNGSKLIFATPTELMKLYGASHLIVQFPSSVPIQTLNKVKRFNVILVDKEIN